MTVGIDEMWMEFREVCRERGWFAVAIESDWQAAQYPWRLLDAEQKQKVLECVRGCERPFLTGESLPANFLRDRKFLRPAPRNGRVVVSVSAAERERQTEQVINILGGQIQREQYAEWKREQLKAWVVAHVDAAQYERAVQVEGRRVRAQYKTLAGQEIARIAEMQAQQRWEEQAGLMSFEEWAKCD